MAHRKRLYGDLPTYKTGPNIGALNRQAVADLFGFSHYGILKSYNSWIRIFRIKGSNLSFRDYLQKMLEANIQPEDIGRKTTQFNLSRFRDKGPYKVSTCRFILKSDNLKEQLKEAPYLRMIRKYGKTKTHKILAKSGRAGGVAVAGKPRKRRKQHEPRKPL
jgi:hypothetical protein